MALVVSLDWSSRLFSGVEVEIFDRIGGMFPLEVSAKEHDDNICILLSPGHKLPVHIIQSFALKPNSLV